jgi:hypothetical protein
MKRVLACLAIVALGCEAAPPGRYGASSPIVIFVAPAASAAIKSATCDCTSYPFKPNPPCFGLCIGKFAETKNPNLSFVKGLDPGVAVSLKVLAASPNSASFDFTKLNGKADLESAAQKAIQGRDIKFEPMQKLQFQR